MRAETKERSSCRRGKAHDQQQARVVTPASSSHFLLGKAQEQEEAEEESDITEIQEALGDGSPEPPRLSERSRTAPIPSLPSPLGARRPKKPSREDPSLYSSLSEVPEHESSAPSPDQPRNLAQSAPRAANNNGPRDPSQDIDL